MLIILYWLESDQTIKIMFLFTDEPSAIFEDRGETNFEDLPPSLDKLGSIDKKTLDETSDKTKMLEEILEKKKRSKKKSSVDPEYTPPDDDVTKKQTPGIEESKKKTRLPRGDRFGNLPRRESMHRTSKNLDAVTRKAMMLYEMSEIYWEAGERKRRLGLMVLLVYIHLYYNGYWQKEENGGLV